MRIFSICKNAKLNNISFTFKIKLHIKHEEDKHKIQHNSDLSRGGRDRLGRGTQGLNSLNYFLSWELGTQMFFVILCLICMVYIFLGMYDMDSIITYLKITRSPD